MPTRMPSRSSALAWLALALVIGFVWGEAMPLRTKLAAARASRGAGFDAAAFYRAPAVLGPEAVLLEAVRARLPPGTPIAVTGEGTQATARRQRFWLALLPDYPIVADAATEICPRACLARAGESLAEGEAFVWIRRGSGPR